jgi:hypothetical protein
MDASMRLRCRLGRMYNREEGFLAFGSECKDP